MPHLNYKELTVRRRPHFQPLDATLFVTFRLAGSIPKSTIRYYRAKLEWHRDELRRVERMAAEDASPEMLKWLADTEKLYREWFIKSEDILHRELIGPTWMRQPEIADKVAENLHSLMLRSIAWMRIRSCRTTFTLYSNLWSAKRFSRKYSRDFSMRILFRRYPE